MSLQGMRVLITGGAGYVGSALVPALAREGAAVTVLDRMVFGNFLPPQENVEVVAGDVRDRALVRRLVPGHDAVIHLAFLSLDSDYEVGGAVAREVNEGGLLNVLAACRAAGVERLIYPSSCSVYGAVPGDRLVDEAGATAPLTDYARYKLSTERHLLAADGLCRTIVRKATICGRAPRQRLDLTVNRMTAQAVCTGRIQVSRPERVRPSLHVQDACRLYRALLAAPVERVDGQIYNAAFESRTVLALAELVRDEVPGTEVAVAELPGGDTRSYRVCSDKLRRDLGFEPRFTVREAIAEVRAALAGGAFSEPLEAACFHNARGQREHDWSAVPVTG